MTPTNAARARWLNRTVLGVGLASLLSDVGHEMATAALPAFLASLGAGSAALGIIEGVADGFAGFAKLFSGAYSDRLHRRKPLAVVGYILTAAGMASFSLATSAWQVFAGRAVGWLGRGARTPIRKALLKEGTTPESYGRAYGLERAMDSLGAVIGPLLALALTAALGVRGTFALTLVPGAGAALAIAFLVREREHAPGPGRSLLAGFRDLPRAYRRLLLGIGIAGLGDFSNTLLILFATQAFTPRLGAARAGVVAMGFYVGYNVVYTVSCAIAGWLADRYPKARVLAFGYSLAVIPAAALLMPGDSYAKFAVVFGFSGLYMGFWETVESAAAATLLPSASSGTGFGVLESVNGVGDFVSSAVVGTLWMGSPELAMGFVAVVSLAGALVVASAPVEGQRP
jgi:MFS family permease